MFSVTRGKCRCGMRKNNNDYFFLDEINQKCAEFMMNFLRAKISLYVKKLCILFTHNMQMFSSFLQKLFLFILFLQNLYQFFPNAIGFFLHNSDFLSIVFVIFVRIFGFCRIFVRFLPTIGQFFGSRDPSDPPPPTSYITVNTIS